MQFIKEDDEVIKPNKGEAKIKNWYNRQKKSGPKPRHWKTYGGLLASAPDPLP